ncbi:MULTISPECIES: nuclear transport factor 2 family protein [unclassified Novosphingobium]|uniref:nuclear transport factor 2 family protein n=1 Tax=unclassified Novosphingobium TaxID=2644732 RepID=UPI001358D3B9|nr:MULTISPECIES: nuclear transport factor 2 family protein [unclassified Novosphingobium]
MTLQHADADHLDTRLAELLDKAELRDLVNRYARAVDRRDMDLLRACYHADAIDNHGSLFSGGIDAYIDWQPQIMAAFENSAHYIVNTVFALDGDEAQGEVYFFGMHRVTQPELRHDYVGGRYLDHYRRGADGRWRFAQRDLVWDWVENRSVSESEMAFLRALGHQGTGADDISKQILPLLDR